MSFQSLSRQFDATRQEIITKYRARVDQQKRTLLTKLELEELIDIFLTRLQTLDQQQDIQQLCLSEIALFEEGYPVATIAKNQMPLYRKAIATAIHEDRIELSEQNSHSYSYFKDGVEHETTEHWAITYFKYDTPTYERINTATTRNNNLKQDSLQPVNLDLYLQVVSSLVSSSEPLELAIALAATSGRRYSEVMAKGHFELCDHPYQILFSGQLKKRTSDTDFRSVCDGSKQHEPTDEDYPTYTIFPASIVLNIIERLRTHPEIAPLENASIDEINKQNTPLNRLLKKHFQHSAIVPILETEAGVTIQNLRSIYGEIAVHFFCPPSMATPRFIQQKLGHIITESALATRKNSSSTEHYFHYYLIDEKGQHLADKGVLLESKISSPLGLPPPVVDQEQPTVHRDLSTPAISIDQDRPAMNSSLNQPDNSPVSDNSIHTIPPYLLPRLSKLAHELNLSPTEAIEKSFQFAEMGIALATELKLKSINPHALFETVQALTQQPTSPNPTNSDNLAELITAKEQIAALTRSLDRITELFYQTKFNPNSTAQHQTSSTPSSSISPPKTEKKTPHLSSPPSKSSGRKRDSSPTVREDINHAIDAIMEFNDAPHRPQNQKFYIGVGSVRDLTGRGDAPIRDVLEHRKQDIQHHLQNHQLDQNHNLSRRDDQGNEYPDIDSETGIHYHKITLVSS